MAGPAPSARARHLGTLCDRARAWELAGLTMPGLDQTLSSMTQTRRVFWRGERVVVEQHAIWRTEAGAVKGEAAVATRFDVQNGVVAQLERCDDLSKALAAAGLTDADVVSDPTRQ